jgi:GT2 family glycosyltransferase
MKKVSVLILSWNKKEYLKTCLPTLEKVSYKNLEIIVVDNGSKDGTIEYLKKNHPKVKIVANKTNLGFAGGNNAGLKKVTGDYILLLNNDTKVTKGFIEPLVKVLDTRPDIGVVQSKIIWMEDHSRLDSIGAFLTNTGFLYHYGYLQHDKKAYDKQVYVYTVKGASMLMRADMVKRTGLFDDDYFIYFEETDFCHRVWLAGYKIIYEPKSVIYHKVGGTSNALDNSFVQYHSFKNRICTYLKNLGTWEMIKLLPFHLVLCEIAAIGFIFNKRPKHFVTIHKAIWWNIKNFNTTMQKRKHVQTVIRKVSDRSFFPLVTHNMSMKYYFYLFVQGLEKYNDKTVIKNV